MHDRLYLTTSQVAEQAHCSTKSVLRARELGQLRGYRPAGCRGFLYTPEDVTTWVEGAEATSPHLSCYL
jgi:hypothetical protein